MPIYTPFCFCSFLPPSLPTLKGLLLLLDHQVGVGVVSRYKARRKIVT